MQAVKRTAHHIKETIEEGLIFKPNLFNLVLDCHADSDFAGNWNPKDKEDPSGVKSQTGHPLTFGGVPPLWCSVTQECIALCTVESEHIALSAAMCSLAHVCALLSKIGTKFNLVHGNCVSTISTVFEDNRAAKILTTTDPPCLTPHSKSLATQCHWLQSHIGVKDECGIWIVDVQSALNKADFLTKTLAEELFQQFVVGGLQPFILK